VAGAGASLRAPRPRPALAAGEARPGGRELRGRAAAIGAPAAPRELAALDGLLPELGEDSAHRGAVDVAGRQVLLERGEVRRDRRDGRACSRRGSSASKLSIALTAACGDRLWSESSASPTALSSAEVEPAAPAWLVVPPTLSLSMLSRSMLASRCWGVVAADAVCVVGGA
jgi:hypothetical protein